MSPSMPCIPHRKPSHKAISLWLFPLLLLCSVNADSVLAAIMQTSPVAWIVRADASIRTTLDLAGKRVMLMPAPESAEWLITLRREQLVAGSPLLEQQPVSASFGITQLAPRELLRELVRNADSALSRTKQLGRNRVAS